MAIFSTRQSQESPQAEEDQKESGRDVTVPDVEKLLDTAREQIGIMAGENQATRYGNWYGLNNNPYSAMFVSWCFGKIESTALQEITSPKGFSSPKLGYEWFRDSGQLVETEKARLGDLVFMRLYSDEVNHVGIVEEVLQTKFGLFRKPTALQTIEADVFGGLRSKGVHRKVRYLGAGSIVVAVARPSLF